MQQKLKCGTKCWPQRTAFSSNA